MPPTVSVYRDKQLFLNKNIKDLQTVERLAADQTHAFVLEHLYELEQEFNTIFRSLLQRPEDRKKFWCYTYYCTLQLEKFYRDYGQYSKADEMKQYTDKIKQQINGESPFKRSTAAASAVEETTFIEKLYRIIHEGILDMISALKQTSNARKKVVFVNMLRMMYMVARLSWLNLAVVLNNTGLLERFNEYFHQDLNLDVLQQRLGSIQHISNALSVALFVTLGLINAAMALKHTALPSTGEQTASKMQRFTFEMKKRHGAFLNDGVWAITNLFTNYPNILGLGTPVVIGVTVAFQMFDLALLVWLWHLEEQRFKSKNKELIDQMKAFTNLPTLNQDQKQHMDLLYQQQRFLEINHKTSAAAFQMNCAAAIMLFSGFGTSFIVATPLASVGALFVCAVAVSLYWSAGNYADMVRKGEMLEQIKEFGGDAEAAFIAYEEAKSTFAINMIKYTLMPSLVMGVMVVSWQAGLALILAYGAYELTQTLFHKSTPSELEMLISPSENDGSNGNDKASMLQM